MKKKIITASLILFTASVFAMVIPPGLVEDYCLTGGGPSDTGSCLVKVEDTPVEGGENEGQLADVKWCEFDVATGAPGTTINCSGNALNPIFY